MGALSEIPFSQPSWLFFYYSNSLLFSCPKLPRYTRFHTTALCSPTRAALLTGRNHHSVHSGTITESATGYPGYDTLVQRDTVSVGEVRKKKAPSQDA